MTAAPAPNESARLEALRELGILDTPPEKVFDDLTRLTSFICGTSIALVSLVDERRQWFKSKVGISFCETPRDHAFCAHALLNPEAILVVPDTTLDPRFAENPLVSQDPQIRFYAGVPLVLSDGFALGTLCVLDIVPRTLSAAQIEALHTLARQTVAQMELRRHRNALQQSVFEHERAEAALRAKNQLEHRLKQVAAGSPAVIHSFRMCPNGSCCFPYASPAIKEVYGFEPKDLAYDASEFFRLIHPDDLKRVNEAIQVSTQTMKPWRAEFRVLNPLRGKIWVEINSVPEREPSGSMIWHGLITDITARKRTEQDLLDSEARFRTFMDNAPDAVFVQTNRCLAYANRAFLKLLGAEKASQLLGRPVLNIVHKKFQDQVRERLRALNENHVSVPVLAVKFLRLDASEVDVEVSAVPVEFHGRPGALVFVRDVTERRRNEEKLRRSTALLHETSALARVGGWELDVATQKLEWTEEVYRIHEVAADFLPDVQTAINFYAPEAVPVVTRALQRCLETGEPWDLEMPLITAKKNHLWVRAIGRGYREDGKITKLGGVFHDITERKRQEAELRAAKEEDEAASAAKGEFLATRP